MQVYPPVRWFSADSMAFLAGSMTFLRVLTGLMIFSAGLMVVG